MTAGMKTAPQQWLGGKCSPAVQHSAAGKGFTCVFEDKV